MKFYLDAYGLTAFEAVVRDFGARRYGYVVTANVDHIIRYHEDPGFRNTYADASYVLLDSRFLAKWLRFTRGLAIDPCPGSDLTLRVFEDASIAGERLLLVGSTAAQAQALSRRYGLRDLVHIEVPMGFIHDPQQVESCLRRIEAESPFRYCFIAVGSPQQEILSRHLKLRGKTMGLALCVGASIDYLTGKERRAPRWLQRLALEWLFRLLHSPRRLARRYLVRGPRIFAVLSDIQFELRNP